MTFFSKLGDLKRMGGMNDVGVESGPDGVKTAAHTYGSGFTWDTPMLPTGVNALDADFRRDMLR